MSTKTKITVLILGLVCVVAVFGLVVLPYFRSDRSEENDLSKETKEKTVSSEETIDEEVEMDSEADMDNTADTPSYDERVDMEIESLMDQMTVEEKVAQLFVITPEALTGYDLVVQAGDVSKAAFDEYPVGGIVLFAQNLESRSQVTEMNENFNSFSENRLGIPLMIGVDEEGGDVARCADKLGTTSFLPMYQYRNQGTDVARSNAATIAADLKGLGFNADFAPVADTWSNSANTVIGTRAYSDDFSQTSELVAAAVSGFGDGGVDCTLKHFPGHGDTLEDSHDGSAYSDKSLDQLFGEELLAFQSGIDAGCDMVMVGHITMTSIDNKPASLSETMINNVLREQMHYDGVVITDSLAMGAVSDHYTSKEACIQAINAGVDFLMMPADFQSAYSGVVSAVHNGDISENRIDQSVRRILRMKIK